MNMVGNNIDRDLLEIEDIFYTMEVMLSKGDYLDAQSNFELILFSKNYKYCNKKQISLLIDKFFENYKYVNYSCAYKMYSLIYRNFPEYIYEFIIKYLKFGNILVLKNTCDYMEMANGSDVIIDENIVRQGLNNCIDDARIINLLYVKDLCSSDLELRDKIQKKLESNEEKNIIQLLDDISSCFCWTVKLRDKMSDCEYEKLQAIYRFIYVVIKDICRNERVNIRDMELLGNGAFSIVFGIGNKVLKLGDERSTERFPNNPYVVPMLLRKKFVINDDISLFVEVTERCRCDIKVDEDEKENFLDKLDDINIRWSDCADRNFGIVSNPNGNVISWKERLYITDEVLGLAPYRGNEILKQGDLVIIDNDCLYDIFIGKQDYMDSGSKSR